MAELDKRQTVKARTYAAQGGGAALIGTLLAANYARAVTDPSPAEIAAVASAVPLAINFIIKVVLDAIHKRSVLPPLVGLVLLVGMMGCFGDQSIKIFKPGTSELIAEAENTQSGRGCSRTLVSFDDQQRVTQIEQVTAAEGTSKVFGLTGLFGIVDAFRALAWGGAAFLTSGQIMPPEGEGPRVSNEEIGDVDSPCSFTRGAPKSETVAKPPSVLRYELVRDPAESP